MFLAEIDQGEFTPEKTVQMPYLATTRGGKLVLVLREDPEQDDVYEALILRQGMDALTAGTSSYFDGGLLTPLEEGQSVQLTNVWEIV